RSRPRTSAARSPPTTPASISSRRRTAAAPPAPQPSNPTRSIMEQPRWLAGAWAELGQREVGGAADNARIRAFFADVGSPGSVHDEVACCAAFVGACLERAGLASTRSLMARSYLRWGSALEEGRF